MNIYIENGAPKPPRRDKVTNENEKEEKVHIIFDFMTFTLIFKFVM